MKPNSPLLFCVLVVSMAVGSLFAQDLAVEVVKAQSVTTTRTVTTTKILSPNGQVISATETETPDSPPNQSTAMIVKATSAAANLRIHVSDNERIPVQASKIGNGQWILPATGGKLWVRVTAVDFTKNIFDEQTVVVQTDGPPPAPDEDDEDDEEPDEDEDQEPEPAVPAPIDGPGFKVAFISESALLPTLPEGQRAIMFSVPMREYLNRTTIIGLDNSPSWRVIDPDSIWSDPANQWAKAAARPRASIPWVIISNGKTGYEGPLPANVPAMMELFKRFEK